MKNTQKLYGIIALGAIIVTAFEVLGCASTPQAPTEIVFDESIPENRSASLYFPSSKDKEAGGAFFIVRYQTGGSNDRWLVPKWDSDRNPLNIIIPQGENVISFVFWSKVIAGTGYSPWFPSAADFTMNLKDPDISRPDPYRVTNDPYKVSPEIDVSNRRYMVMRFDAKAGRTYTFTPFTGVSSVSFAVYELSQTREPNSNEQVLLINYNKIFRDFTIILDRGTNDERTFYLGSIFSKVKEIRIIVPKGEHTLSIGLNPIDAKIKKLDPNHGHHRFSINSEPINYFITPQSGQIVYIQQ